MSDRIQTRIGVRSYDESILHQSKFGTNDAGRWQFICPQSLHGHADYFLAISYCPTCILTTDSMEKRFKVVGILILLLLASVGWYVLLAQNPILLAKARWQFQTTHKLVLEIDNHIVTMSPQGEVISVQ